MLFDLTQFDSYREDNRREVKKASGGLPGSLWETYSAFANSNGGVIILGIQEKEDGSWQASGLANEAKLRKDFWNTINNPSKVSINLLTERDLKTYQDEKGNVILAVYVPRARRDQKPVYLNRDLFNGTYRRNWEGDYHCSRQEVLAMVRDEPEETMDMKLLENRSMGDLDLETVHAYRNRHKAVRGDHVWEKLDDESYLERIGAAKLSPSDGKLHPTAAGLLMFGEEYKILYEFPEYFLDYREMLDPTIRWTDRLQSSSGDWTGNLFDFFFRVNSKLAKDLKIPFQLEGVFRIDDTPVHKAIREALANCLVNADFYLPRGIVIRKDADSIIMENPGSIRTGKQQMLKGGISDPRNKALMKMLNLVGIGERAGSGVPDIFSVWEQQGWQEPEVQEEYGPDRTILRLPLVQKAAVKSGDKKPAIKSGDKKPAIKTGQKKIHPKTQEHLQMILSYMVNDQQYTANEIAELLNLKISRTKEILAILVNSGKLESIGSKRDRRYRKI